MATNELDLTFLTPTERSHLLSVVQRARKVDEVYKTPKHFKRNEREVTSDDVIRKIWKDNQGKVTEKTSYVPAFEALSEALNGEVSAVDDHQDPTKSETFVPVIHHNRELNDSSDEISTSSSSMSSARKLSRDSSDSSSSCSPMRNRARSLCKPLADDKNQLSPFYSQKIYSNTLPGRRQSLDTRSILSKSNLSKSNLSKSNLSRSTLSRSTLLSLHEQIGMIDICLTYLPPHAVKQKTFPSKGTRFPENKRLDVMTRKTYALRTGAKISIEKDRKSGAKMEEDGELHVVVRGASGLNYPSSMGEKTKSYVKCYLLPDRYHGSKMKSEIHKDTYSPKYNHKFVFRGFSEEEFNERSIEIVIGGVASSRGRHPVVGGIRLSNGIVDPDNPVSWKNPLTDEASLWQKAFENPTVEAYASITLRSQIKLTYK